MLDFDYDKLLKMEMFSYENFIKTIRQIYDGLDGYVEMFKEMAPGKTDKLEKTCADFRLYLEFLKANIDNKDLILAHIPFVINENQRVFDVAWEIIPKDPNMKDLIKK